MAATDVVNTPTSFYSFNRYPGKAWYSLSPWNGPQVQGVAIQDDYGVTLWWIVYGIWDNLGIEDWEARFTHPDSTYDGIHWHSYVDPVSGLKCIQSSDPHNPANTGTPICSDDPTYGKVNTIIFGYTITFWSQLPIRVNQANLTHNGVEYWTTPWLFSDIAVINPNPASNYPKLIAPNGTLLSDLNKIVGGYTVSPSYVTADGVTPLFFFGGSVAEIPMTLKITSGSTDDGTLSDFYGSQAGPVAVSPVMQSASNNNDYGVGLYTAPPEFSYATSSAFSRTVQLEADFAVPWQSSPAVISIPLQLIRPPLVMIHGMWSNPRDAWGQLFASPTVCANRICETVDWSQYADSPITNGLPHVWATVSEVLNGLRAAGVAVTKVDVIAHSAGAPLTRLYAQQSYYLRVDNFKTGDLHMLLTLGCAHHGTQIADFVTKLLTWADPKVVKATQFVFAMLGKETTNGIIQDLRTVSPTMLSIQPTAALAHAWIGDLPSLNNGILEKALWTLLAGVCSTTSAQNYATCSGIQAGDAELLRSRVFNGQVNDGLVAHDMQAGGVILSAQTTLTNTPHTKETEVVNPVEVAGILDGTSGVVDTGGFQ